MTEKTTKKKSDKGYIIVMILYLVGIFMGAIDTGIVTPARTIIQNELGVSATSGIWMITIYTLAYAASVPIMGKLADKFGRKYVYIICIGLFGLGSLLCGLSGNVIGFPLLIAARVIQATGGGGIVPIATAEFGTTFPEEKRGLALGLVGGVYGVANVFGASAGSAILDLFGTNNWEFIFYINVPISLFIVICGLIKLKNNRDEENNKKTDVFGIMTLTIMVLSLLYGIKNLDFFDFLSTIKAVNVFPFLILSAVMIPLFILAEKKAEDPIISLSYFTNKRILITLIMSLISGFVMMGVIFVPQFSENCLKMASGSGGYLVIFLGIFSGLGAPISGKMIDKFGPKVILAFGFACSAVGALFMMFVTTKYPSLITVLAGLALAGLGMGFTMGTPVNYMMLADTDPKQSNSALATLSLVRSIGTAIAPAIMVGFVSNAGMSVSGNLMNILPSMNMPELPYQAELSSELENMKSNPQFAEMLEGMPSLDSMTSMNMSMDMSNSDMELPDGTLEMLQSADVTTITEDTKTLVSVMFVQMKPSIIEQITSGIDKGIDGINSGIEAMSAMASMDMTADMGSMMQGDMTADMGSMMQGDMTADMDMTIAMNAMSEQLDKMKTLSSQMTEMRAAIPEAFDKALTDYLTDIDECAPQIEECFQSTLNKGFSNIYLLTAITAGVALLVLAFYSSKAKVINS